MTKIVNRKNVLGFSPRVGISALRLYSQIGRIYAIVADTNKLSEIVGEVLKWEK